MTSWRLWLGDLRTALGDALWRCEADLPLPDHRTPGDWCDDLTDLFGDLGILR